MLIVVGRYFAKTSGAELRISRKGTVCVSRGNSACFEKGNSACFEKGNTVC